MADERPISKVAQLAHQRVQESIQALGGLDDKHLKFLTYFLKYELKINTFRFKMDYKTKPKVLTIHCFTLDGAQEIYIRPKQADILDKIAEYWKLPEWKLEFARREP